MNKAETPDILKKIVAEKWRELEQLKDKKPLIELETEMNGLEPCRGFVAALRNCLDQNKPGIIAEIKKASPSKGIIREHFDPVEIAQSYEQSGAACLSVLTDVSFFQGANEYLLAAREAVKLPVIRKDFTVDEYQIYESRSLGADCVLLIASVLSSEKMAQLNQLARDLGMDVLIEVHDSFEAEAALALNPDLLGINNRNLRTFEVSLKTTFDLLEMLPAGVIAVTESGIRTRVDVEEMQNAGVNSFLVGEAFMRVKEPGKKLKELFF
jgi:indole-3-glycerol phosphate synthase